MQRIIFIVLVSFLTLTAQNKPLAENLKRSNYKAAFNKCMDMKNNVLIASILAVGLMYGCQSNSAPDTDTPVSKIEKDGWYARATVTAITR